MWTRNHLKYWNWDKMVDFLQMTFWNTYLQVELCLKLDYYLIEMCSWRSNQWDNIGCGNGLVPIRHAMTSISVDNTICKISQISADRNVPCSGKILCMRPANERQHYIATSSLIGWGIHKIIPDAASYISIGALRHKHPSLLRSFTINYGHSVRLKSSKSGHKHNWLLLQWPPNVYPSNNKHVVLQNEFRSSICYI